MGEPVSDLFGIPEALLEVCLAFLGVLSLFDGCVPVQQGGVSRLGEFPGTGILDGLGGVGGDAVDPIRDLA